MAAKAFKARLEAVQRAGNLQVADLARWFDRPHATVRGWTLGTALGGAPLDRDHVLSMLKLLETLVRQKRVFPIPRMSPSKRIEHLMHIRTRCLTALDRR